MDGCGAPCARLNDAPRRLPGEDVRGRVMSACAATSIYVAESPPESQMMQIDLLIQAIHGQGAMVGIFIEGDQQSVRQLLDEIALE